MGDNDFWILIAKTEGRVEHFCNLVQALSQRVQNSGLLTLCSAPEPSCADILPFRDGHSPFVDSFVRSHDAVGAEYRRLRLVIKPIKEAFDISKTDWTKDQTKRVGRLLNRFRECESLMSSTIADAMNCLAKLNNRFRAMDCQEPQLSATGGTEGSDYSDAQSGGGAVLDDSGTGSGGGGGGGGGGGDGGGGEIGAGLTGEGDSGGGGYGGPQVTPDDGGPGSDPALPVTPDVA